MDVKPQSRTIQNVLSQVRGDELKGTNAEKREPSWTQLYMETQGTGPIVTLSLPILTSEQRIWRDQKLAGVVGKFFSWTHTTPGPAKCLVSYFSYRHIHQRIHKASPNFK